MGVNLASSPVITAFAGLRRALADTASTEDRAMLRDAIRDALDRDAATHAADTLAADTRAKGPLAADTPAIVPIATDILAAGARHTDPLATGPLATDSLPAETRIVANSWTVTGEIYQGSHFVIERLRHRDLGDSFALKRIRTHFAGDPLFRHMLLREARNHLRVRHRSVLHAHIVLRLEDGSPALVLEYRPGPSLSAHLRQAALAPRDIVQLTSRICEALGEVHSLGLIHGDVTPANILLPEREPARALLCDFGLSSAIGQGIEGFDALGTPGFVAPEAEMPDRARHVGIDIYGLGAVLLSCLDALQPVQCAPLQQLAESLCMGDQAGRPQTIAAVGQILEAMASEF